MDKIDKAMKRIDTIEALGQLLIKEAAELRKILLPEQKKQSPKNKVPAEVIAKAIARRRKNAFKPPKNIN